MISEDTLDKVRELPIESIVEPYVKLSRDGRLNMKGLCPFHSEKTPSFSLNLSKNLYHCFGCNRGGDGIRFIMEKENLSFTDAVHFLAKQHGIPVDYEKEEEQSGEAIAEQKHKESLLAALDILQTFFIDNLRLATTEDSRNARCYAYNRWPEDFCSEAGLGYAPKDSTAFRDFCQQKGLKEELLFELGMLKTEGGWYQLPHVPRTDHDSDTEPVGTYHRLYGPLHRCQSECPQVHQFRHQCAIYQGRNSVWHRPRLSIEGCRELHHRGRRP